MIVITGEEKKFITSYIYRQLFSKTDVIIAVVPDPTLRQMLTEQQQLKNTFDTLLEEHRNEIQILTQQQDEMFTTGDFSRLTEQNIEITGYKIYLMLMNLINKDPSYIPRSAELLENYRDVIEAAVREEFGIPLIDRQPTDNGPPPVPKRPTTGSITLPGNSNDDDNNNNNNNSDAEQNINKNGATTTTTVSTTTVTSTSSSNPTNILTTSSDQEVTTPTLSMVSSVVPLHWQRYAILSHFFLTFLFFYVM